jgi:hypothetical protein
MHHEFAAESRKAFSGTLFYAFLIASLACFPLLGLGGGLLYLCVRYERLGEFNKNLLLLYIAITTSIVIGSKTYGIELDFVNYYSDYRAVLDDPDFLAGVLSNYGSGYEFVMPLSYWVLAKLNIDLNASKAMQIMTMIILVPFIYWAKDCQNISKLKDNKIVLICSILYISTIIYNQLFRQALSSIFILYSLSSRPSRKWLYLLMGTVVHLTTLPLYIIINFLLKRNYKAIIIVFILLYLIYYFLQIKK